MANLDDAQGTQGAAGDPGQLGSGTSDQELLAALGQSEPPAVEPEFVEKLKGLSPEALRKAMPKEWVSEWEKPFLSAFTRKSQDLARERERLLDKMLERSGQEAPPDVRKQLLDRLKGGEFEVIDEYLAREVQARVGPLEAQM